MTDCKHWYSGRFPTTDIERRQAQVEEIYAREEARERDGRFGVLSDCEQVRCKVGEVEEPDPVTPVDRWEWAQVAWCELDTSRLHMMTAKERDRHTEPIKRYVDAKAFEKRFEKWVDGGCQLEKGSE